MLNSKIINVSLVFDMFNFPTVFLYSLMFSHFYTMSTLIYNEISKETSHFRKHIREKCSFTHSKNINTRVLLLNAMGSTSNFLQCCQGLFNNIFSPYIIQEQN